MSTLTEGNTLGDVLLKEFDQSFNRQRFVASGAITLGMILATAAHASPVNEIQRIKIAGTLSGGTYRITATKSDGTIVTTSAIAYNADGATITTALNAVLGTSAVAAVIDTDVATGIVVTFSGTGYAAKAQPLMSVNTGATTGATTSVVQRDTAAVTTDATKKSRVPTAGTGADAIALTAAADGEGVICLVRGPAIVRHSGVTYGASATNDNKIATRALLAALGIIVTTQEV